MCIDTVCTSVTMQPDHVLSPWTRPPHAAFHASSSAPNPSLWLLSAALLTQLWITCTDEQLRSFLFTNVYKTECQQMRGLGPSIWQVESGTWKKKSELFPVPSLSMQNVSSNPFKVAQPLYLPLFSFLKWRYLIFFSLMTFHQHRMALILSVNHEEFTSATVIPFVKECIDFSREYFYKFLI